MPSVRYMNQSAPFWDFVANLEQQGPNNPFFGARQADANDEHAPGGGAPPYAPHPFAPWGWGHPGMPFHGRGGHHGPPHPDAAAPQTDEEKQEGANDTEMNDNGEGPSDSADQAEQDDTPCGAQGGHGHCPGHHGRHGHHGHRGGRRGRSHGRGGPRGGPWGRGGCGGSWGARGVPGGFFNPLNFAAGLFGQNTDDEAGDENKDFEPEADVFDTENSFVVHVSLPGAKKEDVGVNWDAEKSELSIAGVVYRIGDEEFLKTLAMGERKVGPFERKVRLGTRANPAQVDADMITAKLEDGVLRVEVPKLDRDFVEVRKVDIQ